MSIETKTQRLRLAIRGKPYWMKLQGGISLGYRRLAEAAGTWSVRIADGKGGGPTKRIAAADDYDPADGKATMSYTQARDAALRFQRGEGEAKAIALTVQDAVKAYQDEAETRRGDPSNASRLLHNLPPAMLKRPVATLTSDELKAWRKALAKRLQPSTVNRVMTVLKAVLNQADEPSAKLDPTVWKKGLKALPDAQRPNNVVLPEETVIALVHAARARCPAFGLLVEVLAQTGMRYSQIANCEVRDLRPNRLMVPSSFKGKDSKERVLIPVPLSEDLIARLRLVAADRPATARLLQKPGSDRWGAGEQRYPFGQIAEAIGEDPKRVKSLALRHTHITRQLMHSHPVQLVAKLHDTSAQMIEKHYAAEIASQADDLVLGSMLQIDRPQDNVVPLRSRS